MDSLEGKTVKCLRSMTREELESEDWEDCVNIRHPAPPCIEFTDGTVVYPSCDREGNSPGVLFGTQPNGQGFVLCPKT